MEYSKLLIKKLLNFVDLFIKDALQEFADPLVSLSCLGLHKFLPSLTPSELGSSSPLLRAVDWCHAEDLESAAGASALLMLPSRTSICSP